VGAFADGPADPQAKSVILHFRRGGVGTLVFLDGIPLQFQIKWVGTMGEITIDNISEDASFRPYDVPREGSEGFGSWGGKAEREPCTYIKPEPRGLYAEPEFLADQVNDYIASIREGRPYVADGWAGLRHMEIDAAITESLRTGRIIKVIRLGPEDVAPCAAKTAK